MFSIHTDICIAEVVQPDGLDMIRDGVGSYLIWELNCFFGTETCLYILHLKKGFETKAAY